MIGLARARAAQGRRDFEQVGDLVRKCADAMRLISKSKFDGDRGSPFRHIVLELEQLSEEIKEIAAELPGGRDELVS